MGLIHGKRIEAHEIETIIGREFSDREFASLCNAVTWAISKYKSATLPSFTERVNVTDGGIDAEWTIEITEENEVASLFLKSGWNVFQYKRRDMLAQGRQKTFTDLRSGLEGEINNLIRRTGRCPEHYVLFVNLDLTHETKAENASNPQIGELKQALIKNCDSESVNIQIVDAALLASFVNDLPHIRSAYFATAEFSTWQKFSDEHNELKKLFGEKVGLIGREKELTELESWLGSQAVRVIILSGPHNIGKTRLAIDATEKRQNSTIVALDPRSLTVSEMLQLKSPRNEVTVIIEDLESNLAEKFVEKALTEPWLKLLLTFPTRDNAPIPNFGRDERVKHIPVSLLKEQESEALLKATNVKLDYALQTWIVQQAGGNPGILLFAAKHGTDLRLKTSSFIEAVAKSFEKKTRQMLGDLAIREVSLFSLLTHVGIKQTVRQELLAICSLFGGQIAADDVFEHVPKYVNSGVLQKRGSFAEVLPPLFANRLVARLLENRISELIALFAYLNRPARIRLLNRLNALSYEEIAPFWDHVFGENGLIVDLMTIVQYQLGYILQSVGQAMPAKVANFIESNLAELTVEERTALGMEGRRIITEVLDDLLFRASASFSALHCFAMLAVAEKENYGNNATSTFCECFIPLHPQFPLSLDKRQQLLEEMLEPSQPTATRLLAVKAIEQSLNSRHSMVLLRRSSGASPLDSVPLLLWKQVWDYLDALVNLLIAIVDTEATEVSDYILSALPGLVADVTLHSRPDIGTRYFEIIVDWALNKNVIGFSRLVIELERTIASLKSRLQEPRGETEEIIQECVDTLEGLAKNLYEGSFSTRLQIWTGEWIFRFRKAEKGKQFSKGDKEIQELVNEVIDNPRLLTDDLLTWLYSGKAKKAPEFFRWLGRFDSERYWINEIERQAKTKEGAIDVLFAEYLGGLGSNHQEYVSNRLDELSKEELVNPRAIVWATRRLDADLAGVKRVVKLIESKRVDPLFVEGTLVTGGWISTLHEQEFLLLIKAIAGDDLRSAAAVIDMLNMWIHYDYAVEGELSELAWQCLEVTKPKPHEDHGIYAYYQLAGYLAKSDPERGFVLFENLLHITEPGFDIRYHDQNEFWKTLVEIDRDRTFRMVFQIAGKNYRKHLLWTSDEGELINVDIDGDFLISYASETETNAELVANNINTERPDFWRIAFSLIEKYPYNTEIRTGLNRGVTRIGWGIIEGPLYKRYEKCKLDVQHLLNAPQTPLFALDWLRKLDSELATHVGREYDWEEDKEIIFWEHSSNEGMSFERMWAVETLKRLKRDDLVNKLGALLSESLSQNLN